MTATLIWTTIGGVLTICIYTFLYKDNPFYKFAEHLVVGVSAGYYMVIYYYNYIHPNVVNPVVSLRLGGEEIAFGGFQWWMALVPGILGILLYMRFFPKYGWIGRWALGIYVGGYAGLGLSPVMQARVLRQLGANARPVIGADPMATLTSACLAVTVFAAVFYVLRSKRTMRSLGAAGRAVELAAAAAIAIGGYFALVFVSGIVNLTNLLIFVGLLGTLGYFFFSMRHKGVLGGLARIGIVFIMVGFGASFGYTVMSRISLLIGRVSFILHDWLHLIE